MAKRLKLGTRLDNAYANYKKRYKAKEKMLNKKGYEMASEMMTKREYKRIRKLYMEEQGIKININQTIVSDQAYEYSQKIARQFKKVAEEYNLDWKNQTITELRKGVKVDVSALNEALKEEHEDWTGKQRQEYISHEVFGSD